MVKVMKFFFIIIINDNVIDFVNYLMWICLLMIMVDRNYWIFVHLVVGLIRMNCCLIIVVDDGFYYYVWIFFYTVIDVDLG